MLYFSDAKQAGDYPYRCWPFGMNRYLSFDYDEENDSYLIGECDGFGSKSMPAKGTVFIRKQ